MFKTIILSAFLAVLLTGCSNGDGSPSGKANQDNPPSGQGTPEELVAKWKKAILDKDQRAFLECCYPSTAAWREAQDAWLKRAHAYIDLKAAVIERHGSDGWDKVIKAGTQLGMYPEVLSKVELDRMTQVIDKDPSGEEAELSESGFPLRLIRRDGVWYYNYCSGSVRPNPTEDKAEGERWQKVAEQLRNEVREKGLSPKDVAQRYYDAI